MNDRMQAAYEVWQVAKGLVVKTARELCAGEPVRADLQGALRAEELAREAFQMMLQGEE